MSLNRPSQAAHESAARAPARRKIRRNWRRQIILHRAMVHCGRAHASTRTKNTVVAREDNCALAAAYGGPERRAGAWVRAGAASDFRYPLSDVNALAVNSPTRNIQ